MKCPKCYNELKINPYITPPSIQWCDDHKFVAIIPEQEFFAYKLNKDWEEKK